MHLTESLPIDSHHMYVQEMKTVEAVQGLLSNVVDRCQRGNWTLSADHKFDPTQWAVTIVNCPLAF